MGDSLRDQLVQLGLAKEQKKRPPRRKKQARPASRNANAVTNSSGAEINLEAAYKLRAKSERQAKQQAGQKQQAEQKRRQKLNEQLDQLIPSAAQNVEGAEESRYFDHSGRIKRVYVTADQLELINTGKLSIVQHRGRFFILDPVIVQQATAIKPDLFVFSESPAPAASE